MNKMTEQEMRKLLVPTGMTRKKALKDIIDELSVKEQEEVINFIREIFQKRFARLEKEMEKGLEGNWTVI